MDRMDRLHGMAGYKRYVTALNVIHYMRQVRLRGSLSEVALHDRDVIRAAGVWYVAGHQSKFEADSYLPSNMRKLNRFMTKMVWLSASRIEGEYRSLLTTTLV